MAMAVAAAAVAVVAVVEFEVAWYHHFRCFFQDEVIVKGLELLQLVDLLLDQLLLELKAVPLITGSIIRLAIVGTTRRMGRRLG